MGLPGLPLESHRVCEATKFKGVAYLRPRFEDMEYCGCAHWMYEHAKDEDDE